MSFKQTSCIASLPRDCACSIPCFTLQSVVYAPLAGLQEEEKDNKMYACVARLVRLVEQAHI